MKELFGAVSAIDVDRVQHLIANGADVYEKGENSIFPINIAIATLDSSALESFKFNNSFRIAKLLLDTMLEVARKSENAIDKLTELKSICLDQREIVKNKAVATLLNETERACRRYLNELTIYPRAVIEGSVRDFKDLKGKKFDRFVPYYEWKSAITQHGLWFYSKSSETAPLSFCVAKDDGERKIIGINWGSQDYLSLSSHPAIKKAANAAAEEYGVHSAGSSALFGNTKHVQQLEKAISEFLGMKYTALYSTGWAAGYGGIKGFVTPSDHIVMDQLSHVCLQEGARAATKNLTHCKHLDNKDFESALQRIRSKDSDNAILVVTESLFSMDSDTPNLVELQDICRKYDAVLLVDVAHDLGCIGQQGLGNIELQGMVGKIDIIMGSFSKTFASNGGFVATNSPGFREYLELFGASKTFTNALSPIQVASVIKAFDIVQSPEGFVLRKKLMENILYLREQLKANNIPVKGNPSPIVSLLMGDEGIGRITARLLADMGVIVNYVEFPGVAKGQSVLRIQVMSAHSKDDIDVLASSTKIAFEEAKKIHQRSKEASSISIKAKL